MASPDKNWYETGKRFINPYNFVNQTDEVDRDIPEKGNLTGKISCTITVKTPLCIPDAEKKFPDTDFIGTNEYNRHYVYDFYRVGDVPTITGSRLKGVIRSYYEALSNSCFSVNNNNIMSARHSFPRNAGLIKYDENGWHLYPAVKKPFKGYAFGEGKYKRTWYEIHGKSLKTSVFSVAGDEIDCDNLDYAVEDYNKNLKIYEEGFYFKKYKEQLTYEITPTENKMFPVFYEIISSDTGDNLVYLSPSQIGRSVFLHKIDDILGSHISCSKTEGDFLCKACSLFGISSFYDRSSSQHNEKKWNKAGYLRFSDAVPINFSSEKYVTLKELSVPKTTSVEFYTQRPENALAWTYESKTTAYTKKKQGRITVHAPEKTLCKVNLKGRKFYLHNPMLKKEDYSAEEKTKRNCSAELCKEGSKFSFNIYFENIKESQLRELVWTLALGENSENSDRMFKLGYAKPLGLGSVKITVNSIQARFFDGESSEYILKNINPDEYMKNIPFDSDTDYFKQLMTVVNFRTTEKFMQNGAVISYPIADDGRGSKNSKAHHQWFIANRASGAGGTLMAWSLKYSLPEITDEDITLPAFEKAPQYKKFR
ncbi:MAG: hypothetical protein IJM19_03145 [Ruminococcus sp.]|nr:hypothetical protein [Ruminococcus sp.]